MPDSWPHVIDHQPFPDGERASQGAVTAGLVRAKRIKQWTFYKRDERRIAEVKRELRSAW